MSITLEKLLKKVDNKYELCNLASQRSKMIISGAPPLVFSKSNKATTIALEEILQDKLTRVETTKSKSKK